MRIEVSVRSNGSRRVQMFTTDPSRTIQSAKAQCDLRAILQRFKQIPGFIQSLISARNVVSMHSKDLSSQPDRKVAFDLIAKGRSVFAQFPEEFRARFAYDPGRFLDFVKDPKNVDELRSLGFLNPVKAADAAVSPPPVKGGV